MKRLFVFLFCMILLVCPFIAHAEQTPETVVEMTYIIKMPDVVRQGKYTGQVVNGVPHGYGVFVTVNSAGVEWHYLGEWADGQMKGQGGQYWNHGQCYVGTFENNDMRCGHVRQSDGTHFWYDRTPNEHGCYSVIAYRADGSIIMDACIDPETLACHLATIYTESGELVFSGAIGEGFDWNSFNIK